jgi:hypothetical protein
MDRFEFTVRHRHDDLRALYRAEVRRHLGPFEWGGLALAFGAASAMMWQRGLPWYGVAAFVAGVLAKAMAWHLRSQVMAQLEAELQRVGDEAIHYTLDEHGLAESSSGGQMRLPWARFGGTRVSAGHLLLDRRQPGTLQFIAWPLDQLPAGAQAFIVQALAAARSPTA